MRSKRINDATIKQTVVSSCPWLYARLKVNLVGIRRSRDPSFGSTLSHQNIVQRTRIF